MEGKKNFTCCILFRSRGERGGCWPAGRASFGRGDGDEERDLERKPRVKRLAVVDTSECAQGEARLEARLAAGEQRASRAEGGEGRGS